MAKWNQLPSEWEPNYLTNILCWLRQHNEELLLRFNHFSIWGSWSILFIVPLKKFVNSGDIIQVRQTPSKGLDLFSCLIKKVVFFSLNHSESLVSSTNFLADHRGMICPRGVKSWCCCFQTALRDGSEDFWSSVGDGKLQWRKQHTADWKLDFGLLTEKFKYTVKFLEKNPPCLTRHDCWHGDRSVIGPELCITHTATGSHMKGDCEEKIHCSKLPTPHQTVRFYLTSKQEKVPSSGVQWWHQLYDDQTLFCIIFWYLKEF